MAANYYAALLVWFIPVMLSVRDKANYFRVFTKYCLSGVGQKDSRRITKSALAATIDKVASGFKLGISTWVDISVHK